MTFTEYCTQNSCQLLKDDITYLRRIIKGLQKSQIHSILKDYVAVWANTMAQCNCPIKRQNLGRRAANTFIRLELEKNGRESEVVQQ